MEAHGRPRVFVDRAAGGCRPSATGAQPRLFEKFPDRRIARLFAGLDFSAWEFPVTFHGVTSALYEKDGTVAFHQGERDLKHRWACHGRPLNGCGPAPLPGF
jgi:hypothetical protein